jgi:Zn-dependent membrane protease YugP
MAASGYLKSTYKKYSGERSQSGLTGKDAALRILKHAGINDVKVERVSGNLTDHYDPRSKTLRLSESVHDSASVAALGVSAHECGHAIQHNTGYAPLRLRSALVPVATISSHLGMPLVLLGFLLGFDVPIPGTEYVFNLIDIGILVFGVAILFQLVTLPVEFNASVRAKAVLGNCGIMGGTEMKSAQRVLNAAALTYVASAAAALLQLFRLILLRGRRG